MIYFYPSFCSRLRVISAMLQKLAPTGSTVITNLLPIYEANYPTKTMAAAVTFYF